MAHPKTNDMVVFTFTGLLDNGEIFIASDKDKPAQAILGNSDLPPSLESGIMEMHIGETCKIRVPPEEGYGQRLTDLVQTIDNQKLVATLNPKPGMIISLKVDKEGTEQKVPATVMAVDGSKITVDYNHPLAGHHLTYQVTLIEIAGKPIADS
ncbi:MAG: FKBP-type peptidyl-prolyl cis-trans isomerase [Proteobacteria bacterium]|nr:FKBP-type peptidyl-prolyl cis-trans isomerase [Pseudomonadota bacterium]